MAEITTDSHYILVINCGSSSVKYRLFASAELEEIVRGSLERIGAPESDFKQYWVGADGSEQRRHDSVAAPDHVVGIRYIFRALADALPNGIAPTLIAHRVVHGGERYQAAVVIDTEVIDNLRALVPLAPLHNPANLAGIDAALALCPDVPQVAVFDTAFHQSLPPEAYLYGVPRHWYEQFQVRRYGFHGSSCRYVTARTAEWLGKPVAQTNLIVLHLGNGASATAIRNGCSVDTSMGMTPLEGLLMGTRSGDLDPSILLYMQRRGGLNNEELESVLNQESGLKGLSGVSDMRDVIARAEQGDAWARRAIEIYCYRIRKFIGAYCAVLGRVDALVFTGGVGENSVTIRENCCDSLKAMGFVVDAARNASVADGITEIQCSSSATRILVVPTNEELQIARDALEVVR